MRYETGVLWRQVTRVVPFQILREEQRKCCYLDQGFRSWAVPLPRTHEHTHIVLVIVRFGTAELPLPRPEAPGLSRSYHERQEAPCLPLCWRVVPLQRNRSKASSLGGCVDLFLTCHQPSLAQSLLLCTGTCIYLWLAINNALSIHLTLFTSVACCYLLEHTASPSMYLMSIPSFS